MPKKTNARKNYCLGAGMTGLAVGLSSGFTLLEAASFPGGICASYYIRPGSSKRSPTPPADGEAYRFEIGGGHWIFGENPFIDSFLEQKTPMKRYARESAIMLPAIKGHVPYPLQGHLSYLPEHIAKAALGEIVSGPARLPAHPMSDWLEVAFGKTLTDLFFGPFHELYTAGLWKKIAAQDAYKNPMNLEWVIEGAFSNTPAVGYNTSYLYPTDGLDALARSMAAECDIRYNTRVKSIDTKKKLLHLKDGEALPYNRLISTLPLNVTLEMAGLSAGVKNDPYTSTLVLNIGAVKGPACPSEHWLYLPDSETGFHRFGLYSNVDKSFLPASARATQNRVSIFVERAFKGGEAEPSKKAKEDYTAKVIKKLQTLGVIGEVEVADSTWVEVAYTWAWPEQKWKKAAMLTLQKEGILMAGRYGRWHFQGIAESIQDGFLAGSCLREDHTALT